MLGCSSSVRVLGSLLGAGVNAIIVSFVNTRGVFITAGVIMLMLIPVSMIVLRSKNEVR